MSQVVLLPSTVWSLAQSLSIAPATIPATISIVVCDAFHLGGNAVHGAPLSPPALVYILCAARSSFLRVPPTAFFAVPVFLEGGAGGRGGITTVSITIVTVTAVISTITSPIGNLATVIAASAPIITALIVTDISNASVTTQQAIIIRGGDDVAFRLVALVVLPSLAGTCSYILATLISPVLGPFMRACSPFPFILLLSRVRRRVHLTIIVAFLILRVIDERGRGRRGNRLGGEVTRRVAPARADAVPVVAVKAPGYQVMATSMTATLMAIQLLAAARLQVVAVGESIIDESQAAGNLLPSAAAQATTGAFFIADHGNDLAETDPTEPVAAACTIGTFIKGHRRAFVPNAIDDSENHAQASAVIAQTVAPVRAAPSRHLSGRP